MTRLKDYGSNGLIGVLTPQANTTVEPECWALLPRGWSLLNARLTSGLDTIEARLVDYTKNFQSTAEQFANAPVEAVTIACTGASYLIGAKEENRIVSAMEQRFSVPCLTAAQAATAALHALGAKKIALLSPYPESLNQVSTSYWEAHGFEVVARCGPDLESAAFHPIYAISGEGVFQAYRRLADSTADAVLMLGTGMATLSPILRGHEQRFTPAVSCNLALVWAAVERVNGGAGGEPESIREWISGGHWAERLGLLF